MKYDSEFSHKYAANLKSITEQAARLFPLHLELMIWKLRNNSPLFLWQHLMVSPFSRYFIQFRKMIPLILTRCLIFSKHAFILHNQYAMMSLRFFVDSTVYLILSVCIDPLLTYTLCTKSSFLYSAKK